MVGGIQLSDRYKKLSPESTKKIIDSKELLKRQKRVIDVLKVIDSIRLEELADVSLVEQTELLPPDSEPKMFAEERIDSLITQYSEFRPSSVGVGGIVGASLGGLIGFLIARGVKDSNYMAWTGLGATFGGFIGALIGSFWDTGK
jgi:hypothetical protein